MIKWYKSNRNKCGKITGSKYGFYLSEYLLSDVEKLFEPRTVDVGTTDDNKVAMRFYPNSDGEYKINWYTHTRSAKIGCCAFLKQIGCEHYTCYTYNHLIDIDEVDTYTIVLSEKDYVV